METIKTAFVVVLLLAVLYGVYVVLNKPDLEPPRELAWNAPATAPPQVDLGTQMDFGAPAVSVPDTAGSLPTEIPSFPPAANLAQTNAVPTPKWPAQGGAPDVVIGVGLPFPMATGRPRRWWQRSPHRASPLP